MDRQKPCVRRDVLPPVVVFDKLAAVGKKKTAFYKAAIFIDPHIPAIRLIVKIIPQVFGNVDHFHVLRINAAQGFIIGHADIEIVTIQIFRKVYEVARAGRWQQLPQTSPNRFYPTRKADRPNG